VKSLIVNTLSLTKKYIGNRHLIVTRDQLKNDRLKKAWDKITLDLENWEREDLNREPILGDETKHGRTQETVRNCKYILFTLCNEDEAYEDLIVRITNTGEKNNG
jgi:hypothetical protein